MAAVQVINEILGTIPKYKAQGASRFSHRSSLGSIILSEVVMESIRTYNLVVVYVIWWFLFEECMK